MSKVANLLNDLKKIEENTQKRVLKKTLIELKKKAKEILKLKLETQIWLDQFDLEPQDKKSLIDWINNLPEVKISEDEKIEIEKEIKKKYKSQKVEMEKKLEDIEDKIEVKTVNFPSLIDENNKFYEYKDLVKINGPIRDWTVRTNNLPTYSRSVMTLENSISNSLKLSGCSNSSFSTAPLVLTNGWNVAELE